MSKVGPEEKFPLLLYFVETEDNLSRNNKRYSDKGRHYSISSGATAVFKQFPNYIGTWWITTALSCLLFFMLVMTLLSSITSSSHRLPRCIAKQEISNNTIHLVHVHDTNEIHENEFKLLETIEQNYPEYNIQLIVIQKHGDAKRRPKYVRNVLSEREGNSVILHEHGTKQASTDAKSLLEKRQEIIVIKRPHGLGRRKRTVDDMHLSIETGARRLLDILLDRKTRTSTATENVVPITNKTTESKVDKRHNNIEDLLNIYPNIILVNATYNQIFFMTPLCGYWQMLNEDLRIFAVRVLQLWQYGGISFHFDHSLNKSACENTRKLKKIKTASAKTGTEKIAEDMFYKKLLKLIIDEKKNYESLPTGVVSADDEAMHMESKIPCHAFFGEILMNLRKAHYNTTVKAIIQESLKVFCKKSAADSKYCELLEKAKNDI